MLLALGFTGCGNGDNGGGNGGGSGFIGATLHISGQPVWNGDVDQWGIVTVRDRFTGDATVTVTDAGSWIDGVWTSTGGIGSITDGLLTFTVGIPAQTTTIQEVFYNESELHNNFSISSPNARASRITNIFFEDDDFWGRLVHASGPAGEAGNVFVHVDRDVRITGEGTTSQLFGFTIITSDLDLNLRAGWNAISGNENFDPQTMTFTFSSAVGESAAGRWTLLEQQ